MGSSNPYKVLITTSGVGSRLKELTANTNKAIIKVNGKPVISYIIDKYHKDIPIVITLGYLSDQITKYMSENYLDRKVEYVTVDKYEGPGTSCGYSILQAERNLQCPFIFHACDTIVLEDIPKPDHNWTAGYVNSHIPEEVVEKNFATQLIKDEKLVQVNPLGSKNYSYIHMGITAVNDYQEFWATLKKLYHEDPNNPKLTDIHIINEMIKNGFGFKSTPFKVWLDTGNPNTLAFTKEYLGKIK